MDYAIPNILFLKAHTSGLYRNDLSIDDNGQPWIMSLAACLCDRNGAMPNVFAHIIKARGRTTKEAAAAVHGISARAADQVGIPERTVLGALTKMLLTAPPRLMKVVSFGDLDRRVIASVLARFAVELGYDSSHFDGLWLARPQTIFIDIQKPLCQMLCRLPSEVEGGEFRWPSLDEAARVLLGREPRQSRDALSDLLVIRDLYFELKRRRYVEREEEEVAA